MAILIKDETGEVKSQIVALMRYFKRASETTAEFNNQLKQLTPEDKEELAIGAAKEMGWSVSNQ